MRIAYLECFSGISGDMFLGALVDAGIPFELLQKTVSELDIGAELEFSRVDRGGISAVKVDVIVNGEKDLPRDEFLSTHLQPSPSSLTASLGETFSRAPNDDSDLFGHHHVHHGEPATGAHRHDHTHTHTHEHTHPDGTTHSHEHSHSHSHFHDHGKPHKHERGDLNSHAHHGEHAHGGLPVHHHEHASAPHHHPHQHPPGRRLSDILNIIAAARISPRAKQTASEIFVALGAAEAKVHNAAADEIHFHEVGAADAIVDIVCAAVGAEVLGVQQFVSSPMNVGGGAVTCAHGTLPVPAPATVELLGNAPTYCGEIQKELVTPTGAAIAKVLVSSFGDQPEMKVEKTGYGAGARNFQGHPNVLRLSVGETGEAQVSAAPPPELAFAQEEVSVLEANVDDMNPQLIGYIMEQALDRGALDVFTTPVQMKKNRPGALLTILVRPEDEQKLLGLLFQESSTLGVRTRREKRYVLARHHEMVATRWGDVRIKVGGLNGAVSQYAPEYEDCRRIALEHHVPLKTVMQEALRLYLDHKNG
jgi:uncharacterized protein (TIGR00299 family) protein